MFIREHVIGVISVISVTKLPNMEKKCFKMVQSNTIMGRVKHKRREHKLGEKQSCNNFELNIFVSEYLFRLKFSARLFLL